mmetsp:Transcript_14859/g.30420  ORF Transcript_14859/g.30420 Transcript_14859/m.30420 type:complete len:260 (-) Transcript_14859:847-1626(-)
MLGQNTKRRAVHDEPHIDPHVLLVRRHERHELVPYDPHHGTVVRLDPPVWQRLVHPEHDLVPRIGGSHDVVTEPGTHELRLVGVPVRHGVREGQVTLGAVDVVIEAGKAACGGVAASQGASGMDGVLLPLLVVVIVAALFVLLGEAHPHPAPLANGPLCFLHPGSRDRLHEDLALKRRDQLIPPHHAPVISRLAVHHRKGVVVRVQKQGLDGSRRLDLCDRVEIGRHDVGGDEHVVPVPARVYQVGVSLELHPDLVDAL